MLSVVNPRFMLSALINWRRGFSPSDSPAVIPLASVVSRVVSRAPAPGFWLSDTHGVHEHIAAIASARDAGEAFMRDAVQSERGRRAPLPLRRASQYSSK